MTTNQREYAPLTLRQRRSLVGNLRADRVSNRSQGGRSLSYVEAYDIKATLIKVFGFAGFSAEVIESKIERILTQAEAGGNAKWTVLATATLRLTIHQTGAVYTETAAASQAGAQIGEVADFALKTAESDALKRCAIYLGTQFGLSLYNNGSMEDVVKTVIAPDQEWPPSPRQLAEEQAHIARQTQVPTAEQQTGQVMQAITHGQAVQPPDSKLTPQEWADAQALVQRGLKMKHGRVVEANPLDQANVDEEEAMQEEMAAQADTPMVLDRSLDDAEQSVEDRNG
jgi:recombination DNA repair RAD52 pathway protein